MARAHRSNTKLALLFLYLNKFKLVNDRYGHRTGDQVLIMVAARICGCMREDDTVARLGGDEFVVILESIANRQDVETVADTIKDNLAKPFLADGEIIRISARIGIAIYPDDSDIIDELIRIADGAMYETKGRVSGASGNS